MSKKCVSPQNGSTAMIYAACRQRWATVQTPQQRTLELYLGIVLKRPSCGSRYPGSNYFNPSPHFRVFYLGVLWFGQMGCTRLLLDGLVGSYQLMYGSRRGECAAFWRGRVCSFGLALPNGSKYLYIYIYIHRPKSKDIGTTLRPRYVPYRYR